MRTAEERFIWTLSSKLDGNYLSVFEISPVNRDTGLHSDAPELCLSERTREVTPHVACSDGTWIDPNVGRDPSGRRQKV